MDLDLKIWITPTGTTKNKSAQTVTLSDKFVFPSPHVNGSKSGHLTDPKKAWNNFLKRAGLPAD